MDGMMADYDKPKGGDLEHREIVEMFHAAWEADRDNREDAYDDLRFLAGDQWDARARAERELYRRPVLTINRMGQFVRQVTGDMRLNPTAINVQPVDDFADIDKAEIFEGIIRQIEHASNATNVYAHAFECEAGIGIGHFRIVTQYVENSVEEQEIRIRRIMNPLAVTWDPNSEEIDRSDADYCFVSDLMSKRAFKKKYPGKQCEEFPRDDLFSDLFWQQGDFVRVAEFWHREPFERTLGLTETGETVDLTEIKQAQWPMLGLAMGQDGKPRVRKFTDYRIKQYIVSGAEILSGPSDWAGRHIPVIPAIGSEIPLDEQVVRHGIIRAAKDPQRLYNYYRSSQAELIGQQPRAPFLITAEQIKGYEAQWNTANVNPRPYLIYNADAKTSNQPPARVQPPAASPALWQEAAIASDDMKATTGIYDASLGAKSNETSGKAIMARQREGDVGSYHYFDNFKAAIKRAGDILLDLIPRIYDTERVVRIIGAEDDQPKPVRVNANVPGMDEVMNDLSVGKFDVRVSAGPSFSTKREEARESMIAATQANPALWQIAGDLIIKAMDWPYAREIAERIKRAMPPQLTMDEQEFQKFMEQGGGQQEPPPDPKAIAAMAKAENDSKRLELDAIRAENEFSLKEQELALKADVERERNELDAVKFDVTNDYTMQRFDAERADRAREAENQPQG